MDESWDADFDGDLRVPEAVRGASQSVRTEISAAKQLSAVTWRLRSVLLETDPEHISFDRGLLVRAMAIVQASVTNPNDDIYSSAVWHSTKHENMVIAGDSIEDVLREAESIDRRMHTNQTDQSAEKSTETEITEKSEKSSQLSAENTQQFSERIEAPRPEV